MTLRNPAAQAASAHDSHGHIELERTLDSITIGLRHRAELGDLKPLVYSIDHIGLVQPITITPDGRLICGWRRLGAVRRLGWRTVRVWVRAGISDELTRLVAEQDENAAHKPLAPPGGCSAFPGDAHADARGRAAAAAGHERKREMLLYFENCVARSTA